MVVDDAELQRLLLVSEVIDHAAENLDSVCRILPKDESARALELSRQVSELSTAILARAYGHKRKGKG